MVCGVPTGISTNSTLSNVTGITVVTINWTTVANNNGYEIRLRPIGTTTWAQYTANTNTYTFMGLNSTTTYQYQIRTKCYANSSCYSQYSADNTFTTLETCMIPTGLSAVVNNNSASLSWIATNAVSYKVRYKPTTSSTWEVTPNFYTNNMLLEGLSSNTTYEFQVSSNCSGGSSSSYSNSSSFTTGNANCSTPSVITTSNITTTSATLSWTGVPGIASYTIRYRLGAYNWTVTTSTTNSKVLSGLQVGATYEYRIASNCPTSGISPYSTSQNFTTVCPAPTTTPTVSSITNNSANVSWSAVSGIGAYDVRYKTTAASTWSGGSPWSYTTNKTLTGLTHSTAYLVKVASVCASILSVYSPQASFTTLTQLLPFNGDVTKTTLSEEATNLVIHPNPADDIVWLNCESHTEQSAIIYMYDIMGRLMKTEQLKLSIGVNKLSLDISSLPVGYYNIQIKLNNETINAKLMKQ